MLAEGRDRDALEQLDRDLAMPVDQPQRRGGGDIGALKALLRMPT